MRASTSPRSKEDLHIFTAQVSPLTFASFCHAPLQSLTRHAHNARHYDITHALTDELDANLCTSHFYDFRALRPCTYALTGSQTDRYDSQIVSRAPTTSHASRAQRAPLQRHMHSHMCI